MVPSGWIKAKIIDVCEIVNGRPFKPHEWKTSGYPIIRIQNLNGSDDYNYFDGEFSEKVLIKKGQLLFAWSGSKGTSFGPHIWNGVDGLLNYHTWRMNVRESVEGEFFYHYLKIITSRIESKAHGASALVHTQKGEMENTEITIPPLPEQRKIAAILSTWDKAITTTEQLLANSQQQKKALMQQLLTGKKRLLDKNGVRFSGEWDSYELGDWIREYNEKSVSSDQHEVLTSSRGGLVKQSEYFADSRISQRDNIGFNVIPPGYITYRSRSDDGQFFFNRNELSFTGIISTYYPVFHFPEGDSTFFLNYLNRSSSAFAGYSVGTSQKVLSLNALKAIKARLPKKEEQQKIAAVLSTADQEISALQQKLDALKQEKKALMQQLLNGKRRVKVDEVAI